MDKVWFKLRQTHYPPPPEASILKGSDGADAPIRLGHFIKDLKSIDLVLNFQAIEPFPPTMRVFKTNTIDFKWDDGHKTERSFSAGGSAPIASALGLTLGGNAKLAFSKSVENCEGYEKLDTYIVQPTQAYVTDCLDEEPLAGYIEAKMSWSIFMITGLCVARKGKSVASRSKRDEGGLGFEADVPSIASANADTNVALEKSVRMEGTHTTDFVWAVRLARVHKGILSRDWSLETYTKRATFDDGAEKVDVAGTVAREGLETFTIIEDEERDQAFVI